MRIATLILLLSIAMNLLSVNEEFEMDMAKVYRVRLTVNSARGVFNARL